MAWPPDLGGGAGEGDLGLLHVDAVHLSGVDRACESDGDGAGAASEVEDPVAGFEAGQEVGGVGIGASLVEHLPELLAVAHGVAGGLREASSGIVIRSYWGDYGLGIF